MSSDDEFVYLQRPNKKRRFDSPSTSSNPPPEELPLRQRVSKNAPKSFNQRKTNSRSPGPSFGKASELLKLPAECSPADSPRSSSSTSSSDVPKEVLPLVSPYRILKSSKDPNLGLYPKKRKRQCKSKELPDSVAFPKSGLEGSSQYLSNEWNTNEPKKAPLSAEKNAKRGKKTKFPSCTSFANKIVNYFKPQEKSGKGSDDDFETSKPLKSSTEEVQIIEISSGDKKVNVPLKVDKDLLEAKNEAFFNKFRNCYGLVGEWVDPDDDRPNYFEKMPAHVLETILCQIPMLDLLKCRLVSNTWNEVISDSQFMEWKKYYYRLKMGEEDAVQFVSIKCKKMEIKNVEDCIEGLIKFMSEMYYRKPASDMCTLMEKHARGHDAKLVLKERFPDILKKENRAWCIFATAIILCHSVSEIVDLYRLVTSVWSRSSLHDVMNTMYCVAAFLLHFKNVFRTNIGFHFRLYSAIYSIENSKPSKDSEGTQSLKIVKGLPGQQSIHGYCSLKSNLTYEQIRILNHCFQPDQVIKIVALAGTGKTTTLIHLSRMYPQVSFLNVMYNKAVAEDAKKRFPDNVTCKTMHSLAFQTYGARLRHKLSYKIRPHDLVTHLEHHQHSKVNVHTYAKLVLTTIENFVSSADTTLEIALVPTKNIADESRLSELVRTKVYKDALQIWEKMIDSNNRFLRITHDVYLKLYHLSKPKLSEYQCLMVDEAQDCNPAMLDIVVSQKLPIILVGDPNQQIYGFRGAKNALQSVKSTHTYHLTKSFRFGPDIAYVATICLETLKKNKRDILVGSDKPSTVDGITAGQTAIIARSNACLFKEAVKIFFTNQPRTPSGRRGLHTFDSNLHGAFAGGINGYGLEQISDLYKLLKGCKNEVKDKFIMKFKDYSDISNYAKNVEDGELLSKLEIVNAFHNDLPDILKNLKEKCSYPIDSADIVFSTAHKSKGLEFESVILTDDYLMAADLNRGDFGNFEEEEKNIIYVALTRAKSCLRLSDRLLNVINQAHEKFEFLENTSDFLSNGIQVSCALCRHNFIPHTVLTMFLKPVSSTLRAVPCARYLCLKCRSHPSFRPRIDMPPLIMYMDPRPDHYHQFVACLTGPLPSDPPLLHHDQDMILRQHMEDGDDDF